MILYEDGHSMTKKLEAVRIIGFRSDPTQVRDEFYTCISEKAYIIEVDSVKYQEITSKTFKGEKEIKIEFLMRHFPGLRNESLDTLLQSVEKLFKKEIKEKGA